MVTLDFLRNDDNRPKPLPILTGDCVQCPCGQMIVLPPQVGPIINVHGEECIGIYMSECIGVQCKACGDELVVAEPVPVKDETKPVRWPWWGYYAAVIVNAVIWGFIFWMITHA